MKYLLPLGLFLFGCAGGPEGGGDVARGVAAGAGELVAQVPGIIDSATTGGWTAAALAAAFALWKASMHGLKVARRQRVDEVAEGVKKAAG